MAARLGGRSARAGAWALGGAAVLGAALAASALPGRQTPDPGPAPAGPGPAADCPAPTRTVTDAPGLQRALDGAAAGETIGLADGVYRGRFVVSAGGTAASPVHVCGSRRAVLDGGSLDAGYVLHVRRAAHVRLVGFTVRRGAKGVVLDGARHVQLRGLTVERTGEEGVHLRAFSSDNLLVGSTVQATGLRRPQLGEGVYVGSAHANWCALTGCRPDTSDRNVIRDNRITGTTAEPVDVKEGSTGGEVVGNVFDGATLVGAYADSWVDVKGNGWAVRGNRGRVSRGDGFQTHQVLPGWGRRNEFRGNTAQVDGPGFGFRL
ncbi:MAG TPA: right-handed parallel beta-helix repeat-containing protein, partial [Pilimelia sp.]|nr:right-handed parallel beta-helix repeat-containing protein [Pilimelia sp.]